MKQITTQIIILKRINFSEADRILTVITPDQGRLSLLAKGVRKSKSKLAGGLELLSVSDITYIDGRGELKTIISARLKNHFGNIIKDVSKTMLVYDFLKAFDGVTQHGVDTGLFDLLHTCLEYLNSDESYVAVANVWMVVNLLKVDGRGVNLERPLNKPKFSDDDNYDFSYDDMAFAVSGKGYFSPKHIKFIRLLERADSPAALHKIKDFETISSDLNQTFSNLLKLHRA